MRQTLRGVSPFTSMGEFTLAPRRAARASPAAVALPVLCAWLAPLCVVLAAPPAGRGITEVDHAEGSGGGIPPPAAPSNLRVGSKTTTEIRLAWDDNSTNEESFSIERTPEGVPKFEEIAAVKPNVTSFTVSGLPPGVTFQYRVRGRNASGWSEYSPPLSARTVVNWLVLIAINDYQNWPALAGPLNEVRELKRVLLSGYQFDERHTIELLNENATYNAILNVFGDLRKNIAWGDTLLLFYAGHGKIVELTNSGFWLPYDAGREKGQQWLADHEVVGFLKTLKAAKHVLVVADSCYSGNLLAETRGAEVRTGNALESYRREYENTSRMALTSGSLEPVADASFGNQSAFAWHMIGKLEGNEQPYIDTEDLHQVVKRGVEGQVPLIGPLRNAGHETGGGYVFLRKDARGFDLSPVGGGGDAAGLSNSGAGTPVAELFEDPTHQIKALLATWSRCYGTVDLGCLAGIFPANKYRKFSGITGYEVLIPPDTIAITKSGQLAIVTCEANIKTRGLSSGKPVTYHPRFVLEKQGGSWKIQTLTMEK